MSLFTCIELVNELCHYYSSDRKLVALLDEVNACIQKASLDNDPHLLESLIEGIEGEFPQLTQLSFFSPTLWLPLDIFTFNQKMTALLKELKIGVQLSKKLPPVNLHAFQLPRIEAPKLSSPYFQSVYQGLKEELTSIKNTHKAAEYYQHWLRASEKTKAFKSAFSMRVSASKEAKEAKHYIEMRHGVENQLALAYLYHKHKHQSLNYEFDWRKGSSEQTGYGHVMSLALPKYNGLYMKDFSYAMNSDAHHFEENRLDRVTSQKEVKHNRLTLFLVSTTVDRAKTLLTLAKSNKNQHLSIFLKSRTFDERYSYLLYATGNKTYSIVFCDPRHGLFRFNSEKDFLFFYQMLYAKEEMQTQTCWNRYQVSTMRYAPNEQALFTLKGKLNSLLTGLKYNSHLWDRAKNFVLFNMALSLFLLISYSVACTAAVFSPFLSGILLMLLAQNVSSSYVSFAFMFGSSGLFATWDVLQAIFLGVNDKLKSFIGLKPHHEEILQQAFELDLTALKSASSYMKLVPKLKVERQELPVCEPIDKEASKEVIPPYLSPGHEEGASFSSEECGNESGCFGP